MHVIMVCGVLYVTMCMYCTSQESAYSFQLWMKLSRSDDGYPLIGMAAVCSNVYVLCWCVYVCVCLCRDTLGVYTYVCDHVHINYT